MIVKKSIDGILKENIPLDKQGALKIIQEAKRKRDWLFSSNQ